MAWTFDHRSSAYYKPGLLLSVLQYLGYDIYTTYKFL